MARFENISWITFDAAGTLIFPHPSVGEVYAAVMRAHGLEAPAEALEERFVAAFRRAVAKPRPVGGDRTELLFWRGLVEETVSPWCPDEKLDGVFRDAFDRFGSAQAWRMADGTADVLRELHGRDYRMAVLSNADGRFHRVFEELGIASFFEHIFLSAELNYEKPDPRLFALVEERLEANGRAILHVGDSERHDGEGARQAGWHAAILGAELESLRDLPKLLP